MLGRLRVLNNPFRRAPVVQLMQVGHHSLDGPPPGSDPTDGGDLASKGQDRLDLQRCPHHRLCRPDAPAAAQVFQGVQTEPDIEARASPRDGVHDDVQPLTLFGDARGGDHQAPQAARAGLAVDNLHATRMSVLGHDRGRLARALAGSRQAAGEVDGDDVASSADQRLKAGEKVPDRRLRGRRQLRRSAQACVKGIEVVVLVLGPKVTVPADVQADLVDRPPLH